MMEAKIVFPVDMARFLLYELWSLIIVLYYCCGCSVFYIPCNEEPLWMHLCLYEHHGGYLNFEGWWRQSALVQYVLSSFCCPGNGGGDRGVFWVVELCADPRGLLVIIDWDT